MSSDLDLLTRDTVLVSRITVSAKNFDNIDELVGSELKAKIQSRVSNGFILSINKVIKIGDLILSKDKFDGEAYVDITYSAKILTIGVGDVLYGCKIQMINKTGIFANKNNFIRVLIPSDELVQNYQSTFKKNDSINVTIIASRSVVHNPDIIVYGRLYTFTIIPTRRMVYDIPAPPLDIEKYTIKNKKSNDRQYLQLGSPSHTLTTLFTSVNKPIPIPDLSDPLGDIKLLQTVFKSNLRSCLDLYSVLKIFRIKGNFTINSSDSSFGTTEIKKVISKFNSNSKLPNTKDNILLVKTTPTTNLVNKSNIRELVNSVLTTFPKIAVLNVHPNYTLEFAQQLSVLRMCYKKVWLFKSPVSIGYSIDYWIITKTPYISATYVKTLIKTNKSNDLYNISLLELTDVFLRPIRVFHSLVNKYRIGKLIEVGNLSTTLSVYPKEDLLKQQSAHTSSVLMKFGLS